ncbi:9746_t:CDS:2 [Ambispora leptoticha]|uniref:9746_t:CDS:1 n=1 Tax=Ambispora leptoticha TaxID=144679 RepID=A0A9N8W0S1_9GLOM|nr:9746_t:CDS:2 [Ambispora leptoticha]
MANETNRCIALPLRIEVTKSQSITNEEALTSISNFLKNKYLTPGTLNTIQNIYDGLHEEILNARRRQEKVVTVSSSEQD